MQSLLTHIRDYPLVSSAVALAILLIAALGRGLPAAPKMPKGATPVGLSHGSIQVGERNRTYRLYVPAATSGHAVPLLLALHGRLGTGDAQAKMTRFDTQADRFGFIVAYPDGVGRSWNAGHGVGPAANENVDDVGFIAALIDHLRSEGAIDDRRIFAAGMSEGGMMSHRLACELGGKLKAIAAVAGTMAVQTASTCAPVRPVSVLLVHGTQDGFVSWAGGKTRDGGLITSVDDTLSGWIARNQCPAEPRETEEYGD